LALVPGVGSTHFIRLLARFHSPGEVLRAGERALREVVRPNLARQIVQYAEVVDTDDQERRMDACGASLITLDDPVYPWRLGEIYDPPLVLFARGRLLPEDEHAVAVVGTRRPSPYGLRMAEKLGRQLASRGVTVVSGLATGIDSAAHRGALESGGRTTGVLGNGVDVVYPRENRELTEQVIAQGCILSQFRMGEDPAKGHFPRRNRIMSGMTLGTVVVQAPRSSGALITAHAAAEQGREVFAVPGEAGARNSEGPHALLREGAKLVESADDILVELNVPAELRIGASVNHSRRRAPESSGREIDEDVRPEATTVNASAQHPVRDTSPVERDILSVLAPDGSFVDEIALASRVSVAEALSTLTVLELKGLVRQYSGKRFAPR
jgi:DNA processing protein